MIEIHLTLNSLILLFLSFFIFLFIIRNYILMKIFEIIREEYSFYFEKLNPKNLSFFKFIASGKGISFATEILFDSEYDIDENLLSKKKKYFFLTLLYFLDFAFLIYFKFFL